MYNYVKKDSFNKKKKLCEKRCRDIFSLGQKKQTIIFFCHEFILIDSTIDVEVLKL